MRRRCCDQDHRRIFLALVDREHEVRHAPLSGCRAFTMKIESVDFFYLKMPVIRDIGDGSQDALVVRVGSGDLTGWGECEASPLV